jgi:hypothetical protein
MCGRRDAKQNGLRCLPWFSRRHWKLTKIQSKIGNAYSK